MPLLRCTEEECGRQYFEASSLAEGGDCIHCGSPTVVVGVDDDIPPEIRRDQPHEHAHPGHAREKARQVARDNRCFRPPVAVDAIARAVGLEVRKSDDLGSLRARLVGKVIEVNASEPASARRFSVAHELGHYFLGTQHGDGETAEEEADAFAGELLVPKDLLRHAVGKTARVSDLCRLFLVSREVIEIAARIHKLSDRLT